MSTGVVGSGIPGYAGSIDAGWKVDNNNFVHLRGAVERNSDSPSNVVGTLPSEAAPDRDVYTIVHTFGGTYADLDIKHNGTIQLIDPRHAHRAG